MPEIGNALRIGLLLALAAGGCTGFERGGGAGLPYSARGEPVGGVQARLRVASDDPDFDGGGVDPSAMTLEYALRNAAAAGPVRVAGGLAADGQGTLILTAIAGPRSRTRAVPLAASGRDVGAVDLAPPSTDSPAAGWVPLGTTTVDAGRVTGLDLQPGDLVSVVFVYDNRDGVDPSASAGGGWTGRVFSGPVVVRVD